VRCRSTASSGTAVEGVIEDSQTPRVAAVATFGACFTALNIGFQRAVGALSYIPCQMQPH
jgi:hypothetical protein